MIKKHTRHGGRHGDSRATLYVILIFAGLLVFALLFGLLSVMPPPGQH